MTRIGTLCRHCGARIRDGYVTIYRPEKRCKWCGRHREIGCEIIDLSAIRMSK